MAHVHDLGAAPSPSPNDSEALDDVVPIFYQWQLVRFMDGQSPDFPSLLSSLIKGADRSHLATRFRDDDASTTIGTIVEVGRSFAI